MEIYPSTFYGHLEPATDFVLRYPFDDQIDLNTFEFDEIAHQDKYEVADETLGLVILGCGRFRLAEKKDGPFSGLPMNWGDEFFAKDKGDGQLSFLRMANPQKYAHFRLLTSDEFRNQNSAIELIHRYGGGWEAVGGGILTITVPVNLVLDFRREMEKAKLWPTGIRLDG